MIETLNDTSTESISKKLVELRNQVGSMTIGRVFTLAIVTDEAHYASAVDVAAEATRLHPSRIVALVGSPEEKAPKLDAEIRLGGDAGASEIIVMHLRGELAEHGASCLRPLLLADSPVVAWWPHGAPDNIGEAPVGQMAQRRITDASASPQPRDQIMQRALHYTSGDSDMAWARTTRWRAVMASTLDQPPYEEVKRAIVTGAPDSASTDLMAGWLAASLRCPVERRFGTAGRGLIKVEMYRSSGVISLERGDDNLQANLMQPGHPNRQLALPRPDAVASLAEELRRLDKDEVYREALVVGLSQVRLEDD